MFSSRQSVRMISCDMETIVIVMTAFLVSFLSVSIFSTGGHQFKGFMLQVVPTNLAGTSKRSITRGRFLPTSDSELTSCYHNNDSVVHRSTSEKQQLEIAWLAPQDFQENVLVR